MCNERKQMKENKWLLIYIDAQGVDQHDTFNTEGELSSFILDNRISVDPLCIMYGELKDYRLKLEIK